MRAGSKTASHLRIPLEEYDARIPTFLPYYEVMLDTASAAVASWGSEDPVLLDLGIGTGALASRCLAACTGASLIGIDSDPQMLEMASVRLRQAAPAAKIELRGANYLTADLPAFDVAVASFSFHHVPRPEEKLRLYRRCHAAMRAGGALVIADCFLTDSPARNAVGMRLWLDHLKLSYSPEESAGFMSAWAEEDVYFPLSDELDWLAVAGFRPDVLWRRDLFAVLLCARENGAGLPGVRA